MPWIWHSSLWVVPQVIPYFQHLRIMPCIRQGQGIEHLAVSEVRVSSDLHPAIGVKHGKAIIWKQGFDAWTHTHMPKQNDSLKNLGVSPVKPSTHQSNETRIFSDSTCRKNVWSTHSKFRNFVRDQFRASRKLSSFQILVSSPSFALFTSWSIFIHDPTAILHAQQGIVEKKPARMHAFKEQCLQESGCLKLCLFLLHTSGQFASVKLIHKWPVTSSSLSFWRWRSICHHPPIHRPNLSRTSTQKAFFCPKPTMKIKEHRRLSPETISTWSIRRGSTACTQARTYSSAAESMCTSSPRLLYHVEAMDSQNAKKAKDQPGQVKLETSKFWTKT